MAKFNKLETIELKTGAKYIHAGELPIIVHLDDPAIDAYTDFEHVKALTIYEEDSIHKALKEMKAGGVHMLLVIDIEDKVVGLISSEDILGVKPIQILSESDLVRKQISVNMVMTPCEQLLTIDHDCLRFAKIGHVIETLNDAEKPYAMVAKKDPETEQQIICGVFSISSISKQLSRMISEHDLAAKTIMELKRKLDLLEED